MTYSELTKRVKEFALANDMDYVGIASADSLRDEPAGRKPDDYLPGARSVVVMGIRLSLGAQLSSKLAYQNYRHSISTYLWHGFGLPNLHFLDRVAFLVNRLLEREGHIAIPMHASSPFDLRGSLTEFSNIHAAVAAGLGEIGWNGFLLTPDVGPRARFVSIITTAKLEPESLYDGPKLCEPDKCRELGQGEPICLKVCPVGALKKESQTLIIGDKNLEIAKFDRNRCFWASMGLSEGSLALKPIPMPDEVKIADVINSLKEKDPLQYKELMVIGRGDYCGKCIMECPVGNPEIISEIVNQAKECIINSQ